MKVLIIGGTRFLGAAVARELLARDHEITVLHRGQTPGNLPGAVKHILGDARDQTFVVPHVRDGQFDACVDTILDTTELAWYLPLLQKHCGQLVHCGSTGVYAPLIHAPARETDPTPCPPEFGGFSAKRNQDEAIVRFHEETGFRACSLRISNVFGAGDVPLDIWGWRNPAYFQRLADGNEIWIPNDGRALLQPVHVADLARGFCDVLEADDRVAGEIYNLSSPYAVTLTEYAQLTKELLNSVSPLRHVPMAEILATGKCNEGGLRFICEHMCIDYTKARDEFGYEPQIEVREGLADSLQWMANQGLLNAHVRP